MTRAAHGGRPEPAKPDPVKALLLAACVALSACGHSLDYRQDGHGLKPAGPLMIPLWRNRF